MEITQIKKSLSIRKVLHHYNLEPDKNNMNRYPFHNDKTPSMKIYPETGTWTCFSSNCKAGSGDVIEFIQKKENLNKHQAILKAKSLLNGSESTAISSGQKSPLSGDLGVSSRSIATNPESLAKSSEPSATSFDNIKAFTSYKQGILRSPRCL